MKRLVELGERCQPTIEVRLLETLRRVCVERTQKLRERLDRWLDLRETLERLDESDARLSRPEGLEELRQQTVSLAVNRAARVGELLDQRKETTENIGHVDLDLLWDDLVRLAQEG